MSLPDSPVHFVRENSTKYPWILYNPAPCQYQYAGGRRVTSRDCIDWGERGIKKAGKAARIGAQPCLLRYPPASSGVGCLYANLQGPGSDLNAGLKAKLVEDAGYIGLDSFVPNCQGFCNFPVGFPPGN